MNNYKNSKLPSLRHITTLLGMLSLLMLTMPSVYAASGIQENSSIANPGNDLWREVRQRNGESLGTTQIKNKDAGTLINSKGEYWRQLRIKEIIPYGGILLFITLVVLVAFRLIRGEVKIESGRSGKKLLRFTLPQRTVHWIVALLFVLLGLTGLIILLGRTLLLPYLGSEVFGSIAALSKLLHDYSGPIFAIVLIIMFIKFVKGNSYKLKDIDWFLNGGGMFGKHASADRYNAGEKSWFWLAMLGGAVIVGSGLVLDFPIFSLDREGLSLAQIIHVIAAVVILAASLGHIYMGTIAVEGALESMTTGYCDENWAKEHHDDWYKEMTNGTAEK